MILGKNKNINPDLVNILIGGQKLNIVDKTKFLGVILDPNLSWKDHISYITKQISKSIGIISIARKQVKKHLSNYIMPLYIPTLHTVCSSGEILPPPHYGRFSNYKN
jgi:hypothetical protein